MDRNFGSKLQRRLLAEELSRLRRADERLRIAVSQKCGRIDPNPHQIDAVVFALQRIPEGGCILADEVGLGKTIEAGLIISQLLAEGKQRILLIVPKALLGQWQTELFSLFGIQAREGRADPEAFEGRGVFVVHREFAGGVKGAPLLSSADPFDLAIIDEAHEVFAGIYKRFDRAGDYKVDSNEAQIADRVRSFLKYSGMPVLLLTATPIQNSLSELWGLVQYIEPTEQLLGRLPTFRDLFCEGSDRGINHEQSFELRRRLGSVVQRTLRRQAQEFLEIPFVDRQAKIIEYSMSPDERKLYDDITAWLLDPYSCAFSARNRKLLLIGFHRRMGSSLAALLASLIRVASRLREDIEHADAAGWSEVESDITSEFDEEIGEFLSEAESYGHENAFNEDDEDNAEARTPNRLRDELWRIDEFIRRVKLLPRDSKSLCLLETLRFIRQRGESGDGSGKVVLFTESIKTQEFLYDLLTQHGYAAHEVTLFRGDNNHQRAHEALACWQRDVAPTMHPEMMPSPSVALRLALVHEFRHRSRVFISTEAGAKGLNLQFCETLINYDLPWNPQRIEQRIGRVHRYGQRRGVTVFNFLDQDNEAQRLTYEILMTKLDLFGKVLDASDVVLHAPLSDAPEPLIAGLGVEFETHLRQIYQQSRSIEEVTERLKQLRESMQRKRDEFDREQARAAELISTRLDDTVRQVFRKWQTELPQALRELDADLDRLLRGYLQAASLPHERRESEHVIHFDLQPSPLWPKAYQAGGHVYIGAKRDGADSDSFHPGHPLFAAAVAEARQATKAPLHVKFVVDESLSKFIGQRGRLVITRVSYRGFEPVDHLLRTAILERELDPLADETVIALLASPSIDGGSLQSVAVDEDALEDAVSEAIMDDQIATMSTEEPLFVRKIEQLDRFLDDQVMVFRRQQGTINRKLEEAQLKRQSTKSPATLNRLDRDIYGMNVELQRLDERIERLRQGEDSDYQLWRERLFEKRYRKPEVTRLIDASFEIVANNSNATGSEKYQDSAAADSQSKVARTTQPEGGAC